MVHRLPLLVLVLVLAALLASTGAVGEDPLPELSIDDVTMVEGDSGGITATFTVTLSPASDQTVTVDFASADDTATAPDDYLPAGGTLTFDPGQTTQSISVTVVAGPCVVSQTAPPRSMALFKVKVQPITVV